MALTANTGTITLAALRANLDDKRATLASNASAGQKDQCVPLRVASLTSATTLRDRSVAWTQQDDTELRILMARGAADASGRVLTVKLEVENGDTIFLVDHTIDDSVTSAAAATYDVRGDYRTTTGVRVRLNKGVRYRLSVQTSAGTWTAVNVAAQLRSRRRVA